MNYINTLTTVPLDVLLAVLGGLGGAIYADVLRRLMQLQKDSTKRSRIQDHMQSYQRLICNKLGIEYTEPNE